MDTLSLLRCGLLPVSESVTPVTTAGRMRRIHDYLAAHFNFPLHRLRPPHKELLKAWESYLARETESCKEYDLLIAKIQDMKRGGAMYYDVLYYTRYLCRTSSLLAKGLADCEVTSTSELDTPSLN